MFSKVGWSKKSAPLTVFKTLAAAGHGRIEGEGAEMVYIPNTMPTDPRGRVAEGKELPLMHNISPLI